MKATEQYFTMVPFIILYKVVLTFESVDEILKCDHSNESCCAFLSGDVVCLFVFLFQYFTKRNSSYLRYGSLVRVRKV